MSTHGEGIDAAARAPAERWETFCDTSYFDMWCVRPVGAREFGVGFHLASAEEARGLVDLLNGAPQGIPPAHPQG